MNRKLSKSVEFHTKGKLLTHLIAPLQAEDVGDSIGAEYLKKNYGNMLQFQVFPSPGLLV